jgi:hypothetical protein
MSYNTRLRGSQGAWLRLGNSSRPVHHPQPLQPGTRHLANRQLAWVLGAGLHSLAPALYFAPERTPVCSDVLPNIGAPKGVSEGPNWGMGCQRPLRRVCAAGKKLGLRHGYKDGCQKLRIRFGECRVASCAEGTDTQAQLARPPWAQRRQRNANCERCNIMTPPTEAVVARHRGYKRHCI